MELTILPVRMIVFQILFLLVAIAVETTVFYWMLGVTPRKSAQYATTVNLLAAVVGWLVFLNVQAILPEPIRLDLISSILFNRWSDDLAVWIILMALGTFFLSLAIKLLGLRQLQFFLGDEQAKEGKEPKTLKTLKDTISRRTLKTTRSLTRQANAVLVANALSYSAVSLVLFLRLLSQGSFSTALQ